MFFRRRLYSYRSLVITCLLNNVYSLLITRYFSLVTFRSMSTSLHMSEDIIILSKKPTVPSFTETQLEEYVGARGVFFTSLRKSFDVLYHVGGVLYYRMKLKRERDFHDPMESFIRRDYFTPLLEGDNDLVHYMNTHNLDTGEEEEVIETSDSITFDEFLNMISDKRLGPYEKLAT